MRLPSLILVLAISGCKSSSSSEQRLTEILSQRLTEIPSSDAISIQLEDVVGVGQVEVPIRQVNSFGIGIPGGTASVAIRGGGSIQSSDIEFDAYGYANAVQNYIA